MTIGGTLFCIGMSFFVDRQVNDRFGHMSGDEALRMICG
jgi:hypothetical protein